MPDLRQPYQLTDCPGMTQEPFRAGRLPGEDVIVTSLEFLDTVTLLADVSEFQPDVTDAAYLRWSQAIVVRALYGTTVDKAWYGGARRDALHAGGARFTGIYQYIVAGEDIAAQARALVSLLGTLRPGEKVIADIEEGAGSQQARWVAWADAVNAALHDPPWDYSGANFAASAGLQPVTWVASYGSTEPSAPHQLWQFTDSYAVPGVGTCDCSVFHGSIDQLAALAYQGHPAPPVPVPPFPYPAGDYLALASADLHCHSGFSAADKPHVALWQAQMSRRGWTITADGIFGAVSDQVCRQFQSEKALAADGMVGPVTWTAAWTALVT